MSISVIGTGRAAFHLGHALQRADCTIVSVTGRSADRTQELATALNATPLSPTDQLPNSDVILIAVSDDAIAEVAKELPTSDAVFVHLSGASGFERLAPHAHRAVLWPVMTLSPGVPMDFARIPLVVDANTERARSLVLSFANSLSERVTQLAHADRELVHAAAAISTNFPLHLLDAAQALLQANNIPSDLIVPSFSAMAEKARVLGPHDALTGPARRGDIGTVHRHLDRLTQVPDLRAAYALLSNMILRAYGHTDHDQHDV